MLYPRLSAQKSNREMVDEFRGYNHNLRIGRGEFYDMTNMTGDNYPVLSPREVRRKGIQSESQIQGMASLNGLCYVAENKLHYGDRVSEVSLSDGEKQLIPFGAYLIIMPDKVWVNTIDHSYGFCEFGEQFQGDIGIVWCNALGEVYETVVDGETEPENKAQKWVKDGKLMEWNEDTRKWSPMEHSYLKIIHDGVGLPFELGQRIMFDKGEVDGIRELRGREHDILAKDRDWIVVEGSMSRIRVEERAVQFAIWAKMPAMDFVFEHENRLWGCRYGLNNSGDFVNEIYASKLGDFKIWSSFKGISTDSYIASCGTDGKWTGAVKALGYPLFFKENYLHKVYGSYPANYQIQVIDCRGVQEGCHKSLVTVDEVLYYKSRFGVCAYDGSLPVGISDAFGSQSFSQAVAGRRGSKYYISMVDGEGNGNLFCYDARKGFWHREDELVPVQFCTVNENLYYASGCEICSIGGQGEPAEEQFQWSAETGIIGAEDPDHKYISRMTVRLSGAIGARISFYAQYDSVGSWVHIGSVAGRGLDSISVPLRIRRCDHLRMRIQGAGNARIYSITMSTEKGSDLR